MRVRRARKEDLTDIRRIAEAALWDAYSPLLSPSSLESLLRAGYSPGALRHRLIGGGLMVAVTDDDRPVGFADATRQEGHVVVAALATDPPFRRRGVASSLLWSAAALAPGDPVCTDVLLGNDDGERFCEACGLVPGETVTGMAGADEAVARRWWLVTAHG
jgi:GNAT superfamily N-acetyltransferase